MATPKTIEIAKEVRGTFAKKGLTGRQAKLYSQRLRLDMGRVGLGTFLLSDINTYIDEAMLLLECGFLERDLEPTGDWRNGIKRAAEILEWLSQESLKPLGSPLHLLAAASYQLAGFPAMALGQLRQVPSGETISVILREYLRADFPATIEAIRNYWLKYYILKNSDRIDETDLTNISFQHIIMCIGNICAYLRTGNDETVDRSLVKLEKLAPGFLHSRDQLTSALISIPIISGVSPLRLEQILQV